MVSGESLILIVWIGGIDLFDNLNISSTIWLFNIAVENYHVWAIFHGYVK